MEIQELADLILIQSREVLRAKGYGSQIDGYRVEVITGPKYTRIDRGPGDNLHGFLMIENTTGNIYGIKAYGRINRQHRYGNLDTVSAFYWGSYRPGALPVTAVEVRRDGKCQKRFETGDLTADSDSAFEYILKHQGQSVDRACRYEGWAIVTVEPDGTETLQTIS